VTACAWDEEAGMTAPSYSNSLGHRFQVLGLRLFCGLVLLFLVAPILAIIPLSFSSSALLTFPLPGLSLRWYETILTSGRWLSPLRNSLFVGTVSTALATVLGTLAALGLNRARLPMKALIMGVLLSPMIVPTVITAVGVYFFFAPIGLTNSFSGLILAHTALAAPFVVITVNATLQGFDVNLIRAASGLGARPVTAFFRVTLPLILPGVASGMVFAFATSFDEVVVALLLSGPGQRTLPREMFMGIREQISPEITAVATVLIVFSATLLLVMEGLRRRSRRLRGRAEGK
jgi:putative spermidine/putrescine transport system permease protein